MYSIFAKLFRPSSAAVHAAVLLVLLPLSLSGGAAAAAGAGYEGSAFGVFHSHETSQQFNNDMGFTTEQYFEWVDGHMAGLGAHWTRQNLILNWSSIEPVVGGGYNWNAGDADTLISAVYEPPNEIELVVVLQPLRDDGITPLTNPEDYARFITALAERYDGDGVDDLDENVHVNYFQLSNEPQDWFGMGRTAQEYAQAAELTLDALLSSDPNARLILVANVSLDAVSSDIRDAIAACASRGVAFSGVDLHWWSDLDGWDAPVVPDMRAYLDGLGLGSVEIWSMENATYVGCPEGRATQSEENQARSLVKRVVWGRAKGIDHFLWSALVDRYTYQGDTTSLFTALGLVGNGTGSCDTTPLGTERIAYYAYKLLSQYTDAIVADKFGEVDFTAGSAYGYKYRTIDSGRVVYVLWSTAGGGDVSFHVSSSTVRVTNLISDSAGVHDEYALAAADGTLSLTLGADPLLVVEDASLATQIGLFRNGVWFLDNGDGTWNSAEDMAIPFGRYSGDVPVVGDWDGDGLDQIGLFRNGTWYLDNGDGTWNSAEDTTVSFGRYSGDVPVVGDWDGDGVDQMGLFRNGTWYLDNGDYTWNSAEDAAIPFGRYSGDVPVVGDWDGDGTDQIGLFRGGAWYLDNGDYTWNSAEDAAIPFGRYSGDVPVVGDWDGDGTEEIGLFRSGGWYLDSGDGAWDGCVIDFCLSFGSTTDIPLVGMW